jgi:hypothetical protein
MAFTLTERTTAQPVLDVTIATGASIPKAVHAAYAETARVTAAVAQLGSPPGALGVAVAAAIAEHRDPASDDEVVRIVVTGAIANQATIDNVTAIAYGRLREVVTQHSDAITDGWRKPFDEAVDALVAAHEALGNVRLEETATIVSRGGDAAARWGSAQQASATIVAIAEAWRSLGMFTHRAGLDNGRRALVLSAVDWDTWTRLGLLDSRLSPWDALRLGLTLSLPTFTEYKQWLAALEAGRQGAAEAARPLDTLRSSVAGRPIRFGD